MKHSESCRLVRDSSGTDLNSPQSSPLKGSRMGWSLTIIAGGYKRFISVSVTRAYNMYEIEWYRV